ncbi:MAG: hypothetical protein WA118_08245 [Carboxydocellales bacterium]
MSDALDQVPEQEQQIGEIDDEFITVVGDYDKALEKAMVEVAQSNLAEQKKRLRTYLSSEIPVRPCLAECPHRGRCKDYQKGRVQDQDLCKPELRQIKKWQVAFRKGDLESLKDDVGTVAGAMAVQISRLLEAVVHDGVVVETEKESKHGHIYTEKMAHPALKEAANLMKTLGIDLNNYLMTPKAAKDTPPSVQVNIGISADQVHARFAARFGPEPDKREADTA